VTEALTGSHVDRLLALLQQLMLAGTAMLDSRDRGGWNLQAYDEHVKEQI